MKILSSLSCNLSILGSTVLLTLNSHTRIEGGGREVDPKKSRVKNGSLPARGYLLAHPSPRHHFLLSSAPHGYGFLNQQLKSTSHTTKLKCRCTLCLSAPPPVACASAELGLDLVQLGGAPPSSFSVCNCLPPAPRPATGIVVDVGRGPWHCSIHIPRPGVAGATGVVPIGGAGRCFRAAAPGLAACLEL